MRNFGNLLLVVLLLLPLFAFAQTDPEIVYEPTSETTILLKAIYNKDTKNNIVINIDGENEITISAGGSYAPKCECRKYVRLQGNIRTKNLWLSGQTKQEWLNLQNAKNIKEDTPDVSGNAKDDKPSAADGKNTAASSNKQNIATFKPVISTGPAKTEDIVKSFAQYLEIDKYYSSEYMQSFSEEALGLLADEEKLKKDELDDYVSDVRSTLENHRDSIDVFINAFLDEYYKNVKIDNKDACIEGMQSILNDKLDEREKIISRIDKALSRTADDNPVAKIIKDPMTWIVLLVLALLVSVISLVVMKKKNGSAKKPTVIPGDAEKKNAMENIVVRRKTTSILRKQSLDDVYDSAEYKKIQCNEFCDGSTVHDIYIKHTCIRDIYNLYEENLRDVNSPNENGCMVLGRWVYDDKNDWYDVSLEEIVVPGDDAIFQEYELNFGGKIKLKVSERLRKLRRETNLQYDMTCWVHSHPGLGVFFSSADCSVQMQLKHPTHPKFLTAIVVDILTPEQEFGIFTFKHDMSIVSKPELKKMYSLVELNKQAVASGRSSVGTRNYFNLMSSAAKRLPSCNAVYLSNGAIIDMGKSADASPNSIAGWLSGYCDRRGNICDYVVDSVKRDVSGSDELVGCFVVDTHCSLPTIRKAVLENINKINLVIFYSLSDDTVTAIPVVDGTLCMEETSYGEEKLENLKIWTRRKR